MDFSIENLEKAVTVFYRTEALQQAEAHQWLTEAQNSPHAWSFVWALLDPRRVSKLQKLFTPHKYNYCMCRVLKYNSLPLQHYI